MTGPEMTGETEEPGAIPQDGSAHPALNHATRNATLNDHTTRDATSVNRGRLGALRAVRPYE